MSGSWTQNVYLCCVSHEQELEFHFSLINWKGCMNLLSFHQKLWLSDCKIFLSTNFFFQPCDLQSRAQNWSCLWFFSCNRMNSSLSQYIQEEELQPFLIICYCWQWSSSTWAVEISSMFNLLSSKKHNSQWISFHFSVCYWKSYSSICHNWNMELESGGCSDSSVIGLK